MAYLHSLFRRIKKKLKKPSKYCLIHIGKCGGTSLRKALKQSEKFYAADIIHMSQPKFRKNTKYIIVARDPISRCISAFNWRYKLVVVDEVQKKRFRGEYEILKKYKTLSNLAEALYDNLGNLSSEVSRDFERVCHLNERISYYLEDFLKVCPQSSIIDVLMTETLSFDINRVFGVPQESVVHDKKNKIGKSSELSEIANRNLVRYIKSDYEALSKLNEYGLIDGVIFQSILSRANLT